jgi:hypothetical protein
MNLSTCVSMRRGLLYSAGLACLVVLFTTTQLAAQTTTQSTTTAGGTTPLPSTVIGQTPTTTTGTTPTTTGTTGTSAAGATRQPSIVTNQFNTNSTGAIGARSPGKMVEQGLAEATGNLTIPGNATDEPPSFFKATFDMIAQNMLTLFGNVLTGINTFIQSLGPQMATSSSTTGTTTFVTPSNASTTWSGTSQTIP